MGFFLLPHAKCALSLGKIPFYATSSCQHYKLEDYFLCSALLFLFIASHKLKLDIPFSITNTAHEDLLKKETSLERVL